MSKNYSTVERIIDTYAHRILDQFPTEGLPGAIIEFIVFGLKQAWACLFGGLLLALMLVTAVYYPIDAGMARYDFLFLSALLIQILMLVTRLETIDEAKVILIYHIVGTIMEVFKTYAGSWVYPEESLFRIAAVPLFSGFMYAAIGSYIARISRIFDMKYSNYPPIWATGLLCIAIYVNFFSHHYIWDFRYVLFGVVAVLYWRCFVHFRVFRYRHKMPMLLGFFLVSLFIWIAENIATWSRIWLYPNQSDTWQMVSLSKLGSWYLLMIISFVLVTLVQKPRNIDPD